MATMTVQEIKEAIRIAEAAGDAEAAETLRAQLKQFTIND
jgi:hypothetical protein